MASRTRRMRKICGLISSSSMPKARKSNGASSARACRTRVFTAPFQELSDATSISPGSPWQNPYAERLIGTLRRECLDHVLIVGEGHLRRMLASYSSYYNESRTHLALEKDAPLQRAIQRCGAIIATPILSRLHHAMRGYDFREGQPKIRFGHRYRRAIWPGRDNRPQKIGRQVLEPRLRQSGSPRQTHHLNE